MRPIAPCLLLAALAPLAAAKTASAAEAIQYNRDIRPILAENCFACHGPDSAARKADLRLDRREAAVSSGAITPGKPDDSEAVRRTLSADDGERMPPPASHKTLTQEQKEILKRWIASGAEYQAHWSLIAPRRPALPVVKNQTWPRNLIDRFVLARLEQSGLQPALEADRRTLARRLSLDLTGLPPSPAEVDAFVADPSPDACEKLVDRLLGSKHWGEHRGRYWLDAARYADTHGLHFDNFREIWSYRDWVIDAFNRNMPFDRFTIEQLAGDLLPKPTVEQLVASGFHRCQVTTNEGGTIPEENLAFYTRDRTETTSQVWLGLTANCAVCHDHKFDPITQKDFYQMAAFFNNTTIGAMDGNISNTSPVVPLPPSGTRTSATVAYVMQERKEPVKAYVLFRGEYDKRRDQVTPNTFACLPPMPPELPKNRLGLAQWLVRPENPLVARVVVNRFWQEVFGAGLVRTAGDYGVNGELPTHPELLDWLAVEFRESGWDVKRLFRLVATSSTYRQSAVIAPEKLEKDPENRLLSRGPRFRMDAEMVRDYALAASGLLVPKIGGPSVKPYQPPGVWEAVAIIGSNTRDYRQDSGEALYRRSVYSFWKRSAPPASMEIFNAPSREVCTVRRERTNTPLQALVTLDDPQFVEAARRLAERTLKVGGGTQESRLDFMMKHLAARPLRSEETPVVAASLQRLLDFYQAHPEDARKLIAVGESKADPSLPTPLLAAWAMLGNQLMNLDEVLNK